MRLIRDVVLVCPIFFLVMALVLVGSFRLGQIGYHLATQLPSGQREAVYDGPSTYLIPEVPLK